MVIVNTICGFCAGQIVQTRQVFKDGTEHIRQECSRCGKFISWAPQAGRSYRERVFELVEKFADATTVNQVNECQRIARELIRESKGEVLK